MDSIIISPNKYISKKDYKEILNILKSPKLKIKGIDFIGPCYELSSEDDITTVVDLEELVYIYKTCGDQEVKDKLMGYILGGKGEG